MKVASPLTHAIGPDVDGTVATKAVTLRTFALAAAAAMVAGVPDDGAPMELLYLREQLAAVATGGSAWHKGLSAYLEQPNAADAPLLVLARELNFSSTEVLAVALAAAVEDDVMVGRALAYLQAPVGGSRPTLGLMASLFAHLPGPSGPLQRLFAGRAHRAGLLAVQGEGPVPERAIAVPAALALGLRGIESDWSGISIGTRGLPDIALPDSVVIEAERQAKGLSVASGALVIRSGSTLEARAVACAVAAALRRRAAFIETDRLDALGPWLLLRGLVPVMCMELAPGEHRRLGPIVGYDGPVLAVCGPEGTIEFRGETAPSWRLAMPTACERLSLWRTALGDEDLARYLAETHRHASGRIAELSRAARHHAALRGRSRPAHEDVIAAARCAEGQGLGALAELVGDDVQDPALVVPKPLREELLALAERCVVREMLADALGPAARARFHPGVRALFVGPSGTGKTLAAGWLATRLGMPLYRIDLAAVTSKYIGETEKNLAQLIARAEHAEIVLLFDEADSLFGKRTDVKDANDRFANAQTNYLLQRIESFDGIAILTSNSRTRFDSAFTRRLDVILEFSLPGPEERRALWQSHLGSGHDLTQGDLNQFAGAADLCGGHIRNIVLAAAVRARTQNRRIARRDVTAAIAVELRKLGRQVPVELSDRSLR